VYQLERPKGAVTVRVPGRVNGDDFLFVRGAVVAGVGIGVLPWFIANQELAAGSITRVLPEYRLVGGSAWVVHAPAKPVPPKLRAFCSSSMARESSRSREREVDPRRPRASWTTDGLVLDALREPDGCHSSLRQPGVRPIQ